MKCWGELNERHDSRSISVFIIKGVLVVEERPYTGDYWTKILNNVAVFLMNWQNSWMKWCVWRKVRKYCHFLSTNKMNSCKIFTSGWLLKEDCCWFGWIWVVEECQLCVSISLSTFISTSSTADVCNYSQLPAIYFPIFKPIFLAVCGFCSGSKLRRSSCLFFLSSWL